MHSPPTNKAWTYTSRGTPATVLNLIELPYPTLPPSPLPSDAPTPEEWLLIKVSFAALNPGAIFQMSLIPTRLRARTCTAEMNLAGTVVDAWQPEDSNRFTVGDKVAAMIPAGHALSTGTGALAEYIRLPAKYCVPVPAGVKLGDAAGVLLPGLTAWELVVASGAKTGDRVLINAASGGIGSLVVQMVRNAVGKEGYVVGVCSGKNVDMVKSLGADEVIDYTKHADLGIFLAEQYRTNPFDVVIDTLGFNALYRASPAFLTRAGPYTSVGIKPSSYAVKHVFPAVRRMVLNDWMPISPWLGGCGRRWVSVSVMTPTLQDRERVVGMLGCGDIRIVRDCTLEFEEAREGYGKLGGGHVSGKVVVKVDSELEDDAV